MNKRDFLKAAGIVAVTAAARPALGENGHEVVKNKEAGKGDATYKKDVRALEGKRWAMIVDTRVCEDGCTDCMDACHNAHNVPDLTVNPNKRIQNQEIKWIWKEGYENAFMVPHHELHYVSEKIRNRPFITLCNHCDNPPCVQVCPTQATFKRKSDGIVMMDFHRCIGCRFCMAGCPYGSRSFNFWDPTPYLDKENFNPEFPTRQAGVVEKCNFCAERLAVGKMPACVLACKKGALIFGDLEDHHSEVHKLLMETFTIKRKPELGTLPMVYYIV